LTRQPLVDGALEELPLLSQSTSPADWADGAQRGLDVVRRWFGAYVSGGIVQTATTRSRNKGARSEDSARTRHLHFGPRAEFVVARERVTRDDWREAMLSLGGALQAFRQRRPPDYGSVKDHILFNLGQNGRRIQHTPDRATFGLPLTFRYGSVPRGRQVTFAPVDGERHASPLFLRPVLVVDMLSSLFLRLDGDVPGIDTLVGMRGADRSLDVAARNAVDDFIQEMKGRAAR